MMMSDLHFLLKDWLQVSSILAFELKRGGQEWTPTEQGGVKPMQFYRYSIRRPSVLGSMNNIMQASHEGSPRFGPLNPRKQSPSDHWTWLHFKAFFYSHLPTSSC